MKNIAVIGAGTMGNGIAHVFAQNNYSVKLFDISATALEKAIATICKNLDRMVAIQTITEETKLQTLANISTHTSYEGNLDDCDLIVEAATENIDLKLKIFRDLDKFSNDKAILATNTSSISITKIASVTGKPAQVIGMHFMNPVPVMKLVEVINGYATDSKVTELIMDLSKKIGKIPVEVNDYPGFVANRILMPMINEAIYTLYEGVDLEIQSMPHAPY
jgi:3-hydroxybutyryl-CoA dehydrogenase